MDSAAKEILDIISINGGEARIVGGYVRDSLLNIKTDDIDIASNMLPEQTMEIFSCDGFRAVPTGIDFGTVTVIYKNKSFEITTLRSDLNCDGRHADVTYSKSFEEDAKRRDFTFNALYMDKNGKIYDFFNGEKDLKSGIVRFIGSPKDRIKEDYLRILRMFRFHTRYGKDDILQDQLDDCDSLKEGLDGISGERIHQEMFKLLSHPNQHLSLIQMNECGVLNQICPEEVDDFDFSSHEIFIDLEKEFNSNKVNPTTSLAALLSGNYIVSFFEKWRLSKKENKFYQEICYHSKTDFDNDYEVRGFLRKKGKDLFFEATKLALSLDKISIKKYLKLKDFVHDFVFPIAPVTSTDFISSGIKPGKKMGLLLKKSEEIWELSNYKKTKEEILKEMGLSDG